MYVLIIFKISLYRAYMTYHTVALFSVKVGRCINGHHFSYGGSNLFFYSSNFLVSSIPLKIYQTFTRRHLYLMFLPSMETRAHRSAHYRQDCCKLCLSINAKGGASFLSLLYIQQLTGKSHSN